MGMNKHFARLFVQQLSDPTEPVRYKQRCATLGDVILKHIIFGPEDLLLLHDGVRPCLPFHFTTKNERPR